MNLRYSFIFILYLLIFSCGKTPDLLDVQWVELTSPVQCNLNDVRFINDLEGYVAGGEKFEYGLVLHTVDGGQNWEVDSLDAQEIKAILIAGNRVLVAGDGGQVFSKSLAINDNWRRINLPTFADFTAMATRLNNTWLCSGVAFQNGRLFQLNANQDFALKDTFEQELSAIAYSSDSILHAVGYGLVIRSADVGQNWQQAPVSGDFFRDVYFPTPQTGYIVGQTGSIYKTSDGGDNWLQIRDPGKIKTAKAALRAVFFSDEETGCVVGENGVFWITSNGGDSWNQVANFPSIDLYGVHIIGEKGYVAGDNGRIFSFEQP